MCNYVTHRYSYIQLYVYICVYLCVSMCTNMYLSMCLCVSMCMCDLCVSASIYCTVSTGPVETFKYSALVL